jgi:hypothetical protein
VSELSVNLVAIGVFTMTLLSLLGPLLHISADWVALLTISVLGLIGADQGLWQGKGGDLVIDGWLQTSADHRQRIVYHEAGHFLVAHLLGIPVKSYTLNAWDTWRAGLPGRGGLVFDSTDVDAEIAQGSLSAQQLDRYCILWMAGIAAEQHQYGHAQGGQDDRLKLRLLGQQLQIAPSTIPTKQRWATLQATTLLETHTDAYQALVEAMGQNASVDDCYVVINQFINQSVTAV